MEHDVLFQQRPAVILLTQIKYLQVNKTNTIKEVKKNKQFMDNTRNLQKNIQVKSKAAEPFDNCKTTKF